MSLPMTAVGPLKVETKPILIVSAANAEFASASAAAPASQNAVLISFPPSRPNATWLAALGISALLALHFLGRDASVRAIVARAPTPATGCDRRRPMHHSSRKPQMARTILPIDSRSGDQN